MIRLAVDSSAEACSVALDTGSDILQRYQHAPRQHGKLLLPWVQQLLAETEVARGQLDAICVSRGPGSFTSLRLGFSVALGMAYALDIPVYPVSSLAALAMQAVKQNAKYIVAALDARMSEVYVASYVNKMNGQLDLIDTEKLVSPANYQLPNKLAGQSLEGNQWYAIGNGFTAVDSALNQAIEEQLNQLDAIAWPQAQDVLSVARQVSPVAADQAELIYLRNQVVRT